MSFVFYLDSTNYLCIQSLINRINEEFPFVGQTLLLCNDRLLWYTVTKSDLVVLYRYLIENLLPLSLRNELLMPPEHLRRESSSLSVSSTTTTTTLHQYGKFITGGGGGSTSTSGETIVETKLPVVFLKRSDEKSSPTLVEHYLIAYRVLNATLILLVPISDASNINASFYQRFDSFVGVQMTSLASNLVEAYGKDRDDAITSSTPHQYLYYNGVNSCLISTFNERNVSTSATSSAAGSGSNSLPLVPYELFGVLTDLREEITDASYFGDVIAKSDEDYWVASKRSDEREIYALIYHKSANLTEIHEEMRKLCSNKFENKFLLE